MTSANDATGQFGGDWANAPWRAANGRSHWTAFELIVMVLGFLVFWPIGVAILIYKMWTRRYGGADLQTVATGAFRQARDAMGSTTPRSGGFPDWRGFASGFAARSPSSGNRAFDDWKASEISRLDEERRKLDEQQRKLDEAHKEFDAFVEQVRRAKDREEFERFMRERGQGNA